MYSLKNMLYINAIFGATGGVLTAILYLIKNIGDGDYLTMLAVFVAAPLFQSITLMVYTLIGYPVVNWLIKNGIVKI